jgi:uncharacterized protein
MTPQEARAAVNVIGTQLQHEWMTTAKVLEAVPEDNKGYKPEPKSRSGWEIATHLAQTDIWFLDGLLKGSFGPPDASAPAPATVTELVGWYKKTFPAKLEQVLAMPDHKFTEILDFYGMKNPAIVYLNFCLVHMVHHRGQLSAYLRPMGGNPLAAATRATIRAGSRAGPPSSLHLPGNPLVTISERLAQELHARLQQVDAAIALLDGGATVPFIARYRKEATGGLDDTQLRLLEERLAYLRELEERRAAIVASITEQGKMTDALAAAIAGAATKAQLEDLYLPYKPKRRTKAQIAREAGLEPLAQALLADPTQVPQAVAAAYVSADKGVADAAAALDGARAILMEQFSEDADLVGGLRDYVWAHAEWASTVVEGKQTEGIKFSDYFAASQAAKGMASHRVLALLRGRAEGVLRLAITLPVDADKKPGESEPERRVAGKFGITNQGRPADAWLLETARLAWKAKILVRLELEVEQKLREDAEAEAIRVFGMNLRDLLLAAPAGARTTMGLDPGLRTGVKVAVVDGTGRLLDTATIYPHQPRNDKEGALRTLAALAAKHKVDLIAIGNGTASRETDALCAELLAKYPDARLTKVVVSEAGASVYSASELAAKEFPDLDVSLRGAVSIARRLQDPLAELVRIEPKAIGVGQYQHDVSPAQLARKLDAVVEDCVNAVGADVNTASVPLLTRISGLNESLARQIVAYRDQHGAFRSRRQLLDVPRLGERTFQQAAGFLRIMAGENPLDRSAVHPEAYPVVERIARTTGTPVQQLIGQTAVLKTLRPEDFVDERFGLPTVKDILAELDKPGRDPRPEFRTASFKDGVHELTDLEVGMQLEGVVTNVANFGAFVDVGVHQDGLVHVSQLADRFVKDPREVVKAGDIVKVRVLEIDLPRKRIALTMRTQAAVARPERGVGAPGGPPRPTGGPRGPQPPRQGAPGPPSKVAGTSMAAAFEKLRKG